jgi:hypothetical protein
MDTKFDFQNADISRIVYVKPVLVQDLPRDVQAQAEGHEELYAVHNADGEQLALVASRQLAFHLARENNYAPVTVH